MGEPYWCSKRKEIVDDGSPENLIEPELHRMNQYMESSYGREDRHCKTVLKYRVGGNQKSKLGEAFETIDLVMTSKFEGEQDWKILGKLSVPHEDEVRSQFPGNETVLIPSWRYMSDHFMIGVDLVLNAESDNQKE